MHKYLNLEYSSSSILRFSGHLNRTRYTSFSNGRKCKASKLEHDANSRLHHWGDRSIIACWKYHSIVECELLPQSILSMKYNTKFSLITYYKVLLTSQHWTTLSYHFSFGKTSEISSEAKATQPRTKWKEVINPLDMTSISIPFSFP